MADNTKRAGNKPAKPTPEMFDGPAVSPRPAVDPPAITPADIDRMFAVADAATVEPATVAESVAEPVAQPLAVNIETTNEFRAPTRGAIVAHDGSVSANISSIKLSNSDGTKPLPLSDWLLSISLI